MKFAYEVRIKVSPLSNDTVYVVARTFSEAVSRAEKRLKSWEGDTEIISIERHGEVF
jgi:hypothetical protein